MTEQQIRKPLSILLADDGSEHAQAARQLLCDLPLPQGSTIMVASVIASRKASDYTFYKMGVEKTSSLLQRKGIEIKTEMLIGHPAETLVDTAEKHLVDLIVLGAKGLRATLGILLGGVAQQVVEHVNRPVLIVRAPYNKMGLVLAITDGSSHSKFAVNYLAQFPLSIHTEVRLVHVLPPLLSPEIYMHAWPIGAEPLPPLNPIDRDEILARQAEEEKEGQKLLDNTLEKIKYSGVEATGVLLRGDAANEIIEYAKANHADLIVAGSRGMSQVKGWLMGSLSRKLVHYSTCSVLIVRG